jgi:small subunit ribosomal protein S3
MRPELDAKLVAESIAEQLVKRASFGRVVKRAIETAMGAGAKGIKIKLSGRLGGSEMSRRVGDSKGKIPLQMLDARIDYALAEAKTVAGVIGVKVWIYLGNYDQEDMRNAPYAKKGKVSKIPARQDQGQSHPVQ